MSKLLILPEKLLANGNEKDGVLIWFRDKNCPQGFVKEEGFKCRFANLAFEIVRRYNSFQQNKQIIEELKDFCKYFLDCFDTTVDGLDLKRIYRLRASIKDALTAYEQMKEKE